MFACVGTSGTAVSLKTPDGQTAQMLIDTGIGQKPAYLHRSWVSLPFPCDEEEFRHRLGVAYDVIRGD